MFKIKGVEELTANPALRLYLLGGGDGSVSAMACLYLRRVRSLLPRVSPVLVDRPGLSRLPSAGMAAGVLRESLEVRCVQVCLRAHTTPFLPACSPHLPLAE